MDVRKVQMIGGSSLMITLPKEWTESSGIKKNDSLNLYPLPDGSLLVSPGTERTKEHTLKTINSDNVDSPDLLFRILVGAYMSGYSTVEITSRERINEKVRNVVEKVTQTAIGVEIIEEFDNRIILKDLVDPSEMRMSRTMDRMRSLVSNMLSDVLSAIRGSDEKLLNNVISRDNDIDRLEWLVTRQTNMAYNDSTICRKMELGQKEMMMYYTVCRIIERIGDHVVIIAKNALPLIEGKMDPKITKEILSAGELVRSLFVASVKSWSEENLIDANQCIRECEAAVEKCKVINRHAMNEVLDSAMAATVIAGSIRRIGEYSIDISEHAINTAV